MRGCVDAWMRGCVDAWMRGCAFVGPPPRAARVCWALSDRALRHHVFQGVGEVYLWGSGSCCVQCRRLTAAPRPDSGAVTIPLGDWTRYRFLGGLPSRKLGYRHNVYTTSVQLKMANEQHHGVGNE
eukprot:gene10735-biopygen7242